MRFLIFPVLMLAGFNVTAAAQDEPIFSGPQKSERVVPFEMTAVTGEQTGQTIDLVTKAGEKPLLVVFVHERTRPAFGLMNAVARFAESRVDQGLVHGVTFLSADPTATETWLKRITRNLPTKTIVGYSAEGQEGPGAWGLNRNVTMTVVVANQGKVTANFALVQPSLAQDGPEILKALVEVTGGGEVPDIANFSPQMRGRDAAGRPMTRGGDDQLRSLLSPLIQKDATDEEVDAAAAKIEKYMKDRPAVRTRITEIATRIIDAGRLETYGTPKAQEYLKKWADAEKKTEVDSDKSRS